MNINFLWTLSFLIQFFQYFRLFTIFSWSRRQSAEFWSPKVHAAWPWRAHYNLRSSRSLQTLICSFQTLVHIHNLSIPRLYLPQSVCALSLGIIIPGSFLHWQCWTIHILPHVALKYITFNSRATISISYYGKSEQTSSTSHQYISCRAQGPSWAHPKM